MSRRHVTLRVPNSMPGVLRIAGPLGKDLCDSALARHGATCCEWVARAVWHGIGADAQAAKAHAAGAAHVGGPGWGKAKSIILVYLQGGPSHLDLWDPKEPIACPTMCAARFKKISHQDSGREVHRDLAAARTAQRSLHDDSLDELFAQRSVQSHGRHLPDDDRLHDRQGESVGPARAAQSQGLSEFWLEYHQAASQSKSRCCRS